jgi:hypothetical protein
MNHFLKLTLIITILSAAAFLTGCEENPLRAKARDNQRQEVTEVKEGREQETKYGSEISKAATDRNKEQ